MWFWYYVYKYIIHWITLKYIILKLYLNTIRWVSSLTDVSYLCHLTTHPMTSWRRNLTVPLWTKSCVASRGCVTYGVMSNIYDVSMTFWLVTRLRSCSSSSTSYPRYWPKQSSCNLTRCNFERFCRLFRPIIRNIIEITNGFNVVTFDGVQHCQKPWSGKQILKSNTF